MPVRTFRFENIRFPLRIESALPEGSARVVHRDEDGTAYPFMENRLEPMMRVKEAEAACSAT
ncbi:Uncharacterised protein [Bordetella trematum]|nr:Uncharacterised protein [Bordetella trematum]SAI62530.1 Uncharacterised protein [Bordetella trematum]